MLPPTKDVIEEISRTNFHKDFGVGVPEHISLAQLYRWLVFEFVPLPSNIELQLAHLPIFDPRVPVIKHSQSGKAISKIKSLLKEGVLRAKGKATNRELSIPPEYWHLPYQNIEWNSSQTSAESTRSNGLFSNNKELLSLADNYMGKYGTLSYDSLSFSCADIVRVFDGMELIQGHPLDLKKQVSEKTPAKGKAGAKPLHDWAAYKKQYDILTDHYGNPGVDEPELKNQAALETKLIEWGEKTYGVAPSPASMRRYITKWRT